MTMYVCMAVCVMFYHGVYLRVMVCVSVSWCMCVYMRACTYVCARMYVSALVTSVRVKWILYK